LVEANGSLRGGTHVEPAESERADHRSGHRLARGQRGARSERRVRFTLRQREIGHLHGDSVAHFAFPKKVWVDLKEQGRIEDHRVFRGRPGLAARRIETESDVDDVIALLRLNYDRLLAREREPVDTAA